MSRLISIAIVFFQALWHASRYGLAFGITATAIAVIPLVALVVLTVVGGVATVLASFTMLASAASGSADPPIVALGLAVGLPFVYVAGVIFAFVAVIGLVLLFTFLIILPVASVTEFTLRFTRVHSIWARELSFALAGGLTGLVLTAFWATTHPNTETSTIIGCALLFVAGTLSVFVFGTILSMAESARVVAGKLSTRLSTRLALLNAPGTEPLALPQPGSPV